MVYSVTIIVPANQTIVSSNKMMEHDLMYKNGNDHCDHEMLVVVKSTTNKQAVILYPCMYVCLNEGTVYMLMSGTKINSQKNYKICAKFCTKFATICAKLQSSCTIFAFLWFHVTKQSYHCNIYLTKQKH